MGRRDESGSALIEGTIVVPFILLVVIPALLQFGLWYHANTAAKVAAREGAAAASYRGVPAQKGEQVAAAFIEQQARKTLLDPTTEATNTGDVVRVEVRGRATRLLPFLSLEVHATAEAIVERFRAETER